MLDARARALRDKANARLLLANALESLSVAAQRELLKQALAIRTPGHPPPLHRKRLEAMMGLLRESPGMPILELGERLYPGESHNPLVRSQKARVLIYRLHRAGRVKRVGVGEWHAVDPSPLPDPRQGTLPGIHA